MRGKTRRAPSNEALTHNRGTRATEAQHEYLTGLSRHSPRATRAGNYEEEESQGAPATAPRKLRDRNCT